MSQETVAAQDMLARFAQWQGCEVTIFEGSARWGGKAGATKCEGRFEEHGYHIFPGWYRNIWQIVDELGIGESFRDCTQFLQLRAGTYPDFRAFTNITSARYLWRNLTAGVLPFAETFLFFYAALDLISQPYRYRAQLDQVTVTGFLRSRFYRTETIAQQFQELMLKGISVPTYEVSAMTMHKVMQFWVKTPEPMHRILKNNLQMAWIEPIRKKVASLGGKMQLGWKLDGIESKDGMISVTKFSDERGNEHVCPLDYLVLAIPVEKVTELVRDHLYAGSPALGELRHIRTQPMIAFNVYFKRRVANMPSAHVNCLHSRYGISFIDVSQTWGTSDRTVLNLIASDVTDLESVSPSVAVAALMDDLRRYLPPFDVADVERITFQSHRN
jgi:protoporphyrinogen oxidase